MKRKRGGCGHPVLGKDLGMSLSLSVTGGDDGCPIILNNELFGLENLTF